MGEGNLPNSLLIDFRNNFDFQFWEAQLLCLVLCVCEAKNSSTLIANLFALAKAFFAPSFHAFPAPPSPHPSCSLFSLFALRCTRFLLPLFLCFWLSLLHFLYLPASIHVSIFSKFLFFFCQLHLRLTNSPERGKRVAGKCLQFSRLADAIKQFDAGINTPPVLQSSSHPVQYADQARNSISFLAEMLMEFDS